jgi:hypothetical protein
MIANTARLRKDNVNRVLLHLEENIVGSVRRVIISPEAMVIQSLRDGSPEKPADREHDSVNNPI